MLEILVEAVPLIIGGILGWIIRDEYWAKGISRFVQMAIASLLLGGFHSWIAGELTADILSSLAAILIDSAAIMLGFVGARLLRAWRKAGELQRRN